MKKRLRKKLHKGEFAVFGVSLKVSFSLNLSEAVFDQFIDDFIEHAIEARGLSFGGGGSRDKGWAGVIQPRKFETIIREDDLVWLRAWLVKQAVVESFELSKPWDIWYGENPF